jgi:trimeric autotransporter adhesin
MLLSQDAARRGCAAALTATLLGLFAAPVEAIESRESRSPLAAHVFVNERFQPRPLLQPAATAAPALPSAVRDGWAAFGALYPRWTAVFDRRSGALEMAEGDGIPLLPGSGNELTNGDIAAYMGGKTTVDLTVAERATRAFLPRVASLLGVDPATLVLNPDRSGQPTPNVWFVDFDVVRAGLPIDGARVIFRIGHGNLIQLGGENLPSADAAVPAVALTREQAVSSLADFLGGLTPFDRFLDAGSLHLLPVSLDDNRFAEGFESGRGRGLLSVWQLTFRRDKEPETWRARIDASTGEVLELRDTNEWAQVTGGANNLGVETVRPMPFADLSSGGNANSAGLYNYTIGTVSSTLAGPYARINDTCGLISQSSDVEGNIAFGASGGTDCTTPGSGGGGNTHASRTQFYHLNRAKEVARGWLSRPWLNQQLTANVNIADTCNAGWNGSTVNFFLSGGGCGNTGEIEAVSLHEYGHGLDSNDGNGSAPENGTGETYGDFTAALATHSSCIGNGFRPTNCTGNGDPCTACTGVRDIDWAKHNSNAPHTVANFTQPLCPTSPIGYVGPCNREGHCESYISSEALWDIANRDLPSPGSGAAWTVVDRLWYLSRSTATSAFVCTTGGTFTSNGCNTGSLWKTMRAVDDDDGNLANGTPNSAALYAAFNRHGIACTTDTGANVSFRGCTQPLSPALLLVPGDNQVTVTWAGSTGVYDVYRNEIGCDAGFTKIGNDLAASPLVDNNVANGIPYYYQMVAQPAGNESCASVPSTCMAVTPTAPACSPLGAPSNVVATGGASQISLTWNAVGGATFYNVLRSNGAGGPYTRIAQPTGTSYVDTAPACGETRYYVVQAASSSTCHSANSAEVSATTNACPPCTTQSLYTNNFDSASGLAGWSVGSFAGGSTTDWRGVQTCTAHSGANVFRFGGTTCTGNYANNDYNYAQPNGAAGIAVPAGASVNRLTFWHRRDFETGFDGGTLSLSLDGTTYVPVPAAAILSGSYNGSVAPDCAPAGSAGRSIYSGTASSFSQTVVDLDAACTLAGATEGCGGQSVRIAFTAISDCGTTGDGWFLDDVDVASCVPLASLLSDGFESGTLSAWAGHSP